MLFKVIKQYHITENLGDREKTSIPTNNSTQTQAYCHFGATPSQHFSVLQVFLHSL